MFKGLVGKSIVPTCESFELNCICGGGDYWRLALVWGSYYA